jgi:hypothetical protein
VAKVHRRTFFLTLAQIIIILLAIGRLLFGIAAIGFGVFILVAGHSHLSEVPGYDQYVRQFGNAVFNLAAALFFIIGTPFLIAGIVDLILGILVGRPSNVARWFIIVLDVLSALYLLALLSRNNVGATAALVLVILLALKVIVFYALALEPATRRNFAGTSRIAAPPGAISAPGA